MCKFNCFTTFSFSIAEKVTHKHFILSVFLLLFLSGRAQKQTDALKATGDYKYPPYEYLDENDSPTGFNVELLYAIADVMDLDISIELKPWHEARADLESGHVDLVNGLFYSEERAKQFSFSLPHSMVSQAVFCREGELYDLEELKDKAIIVQNGDIMHDYAIKHHIGNELILAEDLEGALKMLENGNGLAYLGSHFPGMYFIRKHNLNLQAKIIPGEVRPYCFGFQKNSEVLQQQLNEGLNILKSNGEYDRIYEKYFGVYEKDAFRLKLMQIIAWMFFIVLILSVMFILWSLSLKNQVKRKTRELSAELKRRCETEEKLEETNHHLQQLIEELKQQEESLVKAYEKARKADELKNAFLANISHEIRTPLNSILGFSDLLYSEDTDVDDQRRFSKIILNNGFKLNRLLNDLLEASRIESGDIQLEIKEFDFNKMLRQVFDSYQADPKIKAGHLELILDNKYPDEEFLIRSDELRIAQVYHNLINNALKFTESGSITFGYHKKQDQKLICFVKDTGRGIPEDKLEVIFERFRHADEQSTFYVKGVGLGLSICKNLVYLLGGSIHVESKLNEGSTFTFSISREL